MEATSGTASTWNADMGYEYLKHGIRLLSGVSVSRETGISHDKNRYQGLE